MTFPNQLTVPLLRDVKSQVPQAICEQTPEGGVNRHLLINRDVPPFNDQELRRAMALTIDRKAFIDIISERHGDIGGGPHPPPRGVCGVRAGTPSGITGSRPT